MDSASDPFSVRLASTAEDVEAVQRLRYEVFVEELGAMTKGADHRARLEQDKYDADALHLILEDHRAPGRVAGAYRLIPGEVATRIGGFYSEAEYDLSRLIQSGRSLLELGRSVLAPEYRGGTGMYRLWQGLAEYVLANRVEVLFGVASFHGTDKAPYAQALSLLHHRFLAPEDLRVTARPEAFQSMDLVAEDKIDRLAAMRTTPALIKAYLRLGGCIGEGAYIDHDFNTIDVCLVMDTKAMNEQARLRFAGGAE